MRRIRHVSVASTRSGAELIPIADSDSDSTANDEYYGDVLVGTLALCRLCWRSAFCCRLFDSANDKTQMVQEV